MFTLVRDTEKKWLFWSDCRGAYQHLFNLPGSRTGEVKDVSWSGESYSVCSWSSSSSSSYLAPEQNMFWHRLFGTTHNETVSCSWKPLHVSSRLRLTASSAQANGPTLGIALTTIQLITETVSSSQVCSWTMPHAARLHNYWDGQQTFQAVHAATSRAALGSRAGHATKVQIIERRKVKHTSNCEWFEVRCKHSECPVKHVSKQFKTHLQMS